MAELTSVGLDVGTTTTQLIVSRLTVENRASAFSVPELVIGDRQVLYRSPVYFTPLLGKDRVDGEKIREILTKEYEKAGIDRENVDTGAVIITGETSRKENARAVLEALAGFAGDFVVATAGPDLESVLAAKGAGAVALSAQTGKKVLHFDIGGGTSNLALIEDGEVIQTGCLNVGGRLIKFDENGIITYISPVLQEICGLKVGEMAARDAVEAVADTLVQALEMAAGLRHPTKIMEVLWTKEAVQPWTVPEKGTLFSFSGGVADCIEKEEYWLQYGDIGPILGQKIRKSGLCAGTYFVGKETIRATVIGAGSHSVQLSGSTVFCRNVALPLKNRPVICLKIEELQHPDRIRQKMAGLDKVPFVALLGHFEVNYREIQALSEALVALFPATAIYAATETDMAKALGQRMALLTDSPVLCLDGLRLEGDCYLDVGEPVGSAFPVVVKTLIMDRG